MGSVTRDLVGGDRAQVDRLTCGRAPHRYLVQVVCKCRGLLSSPHVIAVTTDAVILLTRGRTDVGDGSGCVRRPRDRYLFHAVRSTLEEVYPKVVPVNGDTRRISRQGDGLDECTRLEIESLDGVASKTGHPDDVAVRGNTNGVTGCVHRGTKTRVAHRTGPRELRDHRVLGNDDDVRRRADRGGVD